MADMTPQGTQEYAVVSGYESGDANVKAVVSGLMIILGSTLVVMAAMFGMFNFLNRQAIEQESQIPASLTKRMVPPEPRLLPLPYTDTVEEAQREAIKNNVSPQTVTADGYPWDKRNLEIVNQYDEANAYANYKGEGNKAQIRIPIARAMEIEAGKTTGGTPAIMTWQNEHARLLAGEQGGSMNLTVGQKKESPDTFDERWRWETQDEKFSNESSGGVELKDEQLSR